MAAFEKNPEGVVKAIVSLVDGAIETGLIEDNTGLLTRRDYPVECEAPGIRSRGAGGLTLDDVYGVRTRDVVDRIKARVPNYEWNPAKRHVADMIERGFNLAKDETKAAARLGVLRFMSILWVGSYRNWLAPRRARRQSTPGRRAARPHAEPGLRD